MDNDQLSSNNAALVRECLDIVANDSENLERTIRMMTDDCVWVMEPTGDTFNGMEELKAFVGTAMSGRTHGGQYNIQITNWFASGEYLCIEYTHGAVSTGAYTFGLKLKLKQGILKYCITYHMRNGKFDWIHEYIQGTTLLTTVFMPFVLRRLKRLTQKKLDAAKLNSKQLAQ